MRINFGFHVNRKLEYIVTYILHMHRNTCILLPNNIVGTWRFGVQSPHGALTPCWRSCWHPPLPHLSRFCLQRENSQNGFMHVTIFFMVSIQSIESYHSKAVPQILLTKLLPQFWDFKINIFCKCHSYQHFLACYS